MSAEHPIDSDPTYANCVSELLRPVLQRLEEFHVMRINTAVALERSRCADLAMRYAAAERPHDARNARLFQELGNAIQHPNDKQHLKETP